jgi:hypothetical protein
MLLVWSTKGGWDTHVARMVALQMHKDFSRKTEGKKPIMRPRNICENGNEPLRFLKSMYFLTIGAINSFSEKILLHEVN